MSWFSGKIMDAAAGRESRSAFIAQAAFWFAALRFVTHDVCLELGSGKTQLFKLDFGKMDAMLMGAFLLPCLSLYFGRRLFPGSPEVKQTQQSPSPPAQKPEDQGGPVG